MVWGKLMATGAVVVASLSSPAVIGEVFASQNVDALFDEATAGTVNMASDLYPFQVRSVTAADSASLITNPETPMLESSLHSIDSPDSAVHEEDIARPLILSIFGMVLVVSGIWLGRRKR